MRCFIRISTLLLATLLMSAASLAAEETAPSDAELTRQVARLVRQLDDDLAAERDAAEEKLLDLAGANASSVDAVLALLPVENDQMPPAVRDRLARVRTLAEDRAAKAATAATSVTLDAKEMPLIEVFTTIEKQTGNRMSDRRREGDDDGNARPLPVTLTLANEPYWSVVDKVLDAARLGVSNYAGDDSLALIEREPGDGPRFGRAAYGGPFRIEALEVLGQRNLRKPERQLLNLQLEVSWEPRLRPIAVSQAAAELTAVDEHGNDLPVSQPDAVLDAEIPTGTKATELILPFQLAPRDVTKIASLKGKLRALVPGRQVKFKFDDLARAAGKSLRRGGVEVAVDAVRSSNEVWEIHMRLRLEEDNHALESHRGWAFGNLSYLIDKDGTTIENGGLETTMQSPNEVGVAYFFEAPQGLDGVTWVYETPAAIVELPIDYELKDIPLP